jgi:transposase
LPDPRRRGAGGAVRPTSFPVHHRLRGRGRVPGHRTDKSTIARFLRIDWDTIGRICERVVATELDEDRLAGLVNIGVDEISWRKHHKYLTLVTDHTRRKVVWGKAGKDTATLDAFFDDLGVAGSYDIEAVSMDMGPAFARSVRAEGHAPQAIICIDPFVRHEALRYRVEVRGLHRRPVAAGR